MKAGRPPLLTFAEIKQIKSAWRAGMNHTEICVEYGIGASTLWEYAKAYGFGPKPRNQHKYNGRRGVEPVASMWACPICGTRSRDVNGHELCQNRGEAA